MDRDEVCNIYMQRIKSPINWMCISFVSKVIGFVCELS